jgi:hypothetical protein
MLQKLLKMAKTKLLKVGFSLESTDQERETRNSLLNEKLNDARNAVAP